MDGMFCYQCQETVGNTGCTKVGVCGKQPEVAALQDLLVYLTKGLSQVTTALRGQGDSVGKQVDILVATNLFVTITNANFDAESITKQIIETIETKENLIAMVKDRSQLTDAALWNKTNPEDLEAKAKTVGALTTIDETRRSLQNLVLYGLKGLAAYLHHASVLGHSNPEIDHFLQSALAKILEPDRSVEDLIALTLETGSFGVKGMALLDTANTQSYGHPELSTVIIGVRSNPAILISGHDLKDLEILLEQTQGTGVDVYTHSEMLPAHYYPAFKKYDHFVGNYGNAWWKQKEEFESFGGPILMTTNCIVPPTPAYKDRLYTTGTTGFEGCTHIPADPSGNKDFSKIIAHAKTCSTPIEIETGEIVGGFAHNQVFALADQVVDAVKSGAVKKFVVMAGCDGRMKSRGYYTDFAQKLPEDTIILTAGCAKYRYNKLGLGSIGGIPRVLDAGQCNDSYSLALIALKLQEVFGLEDINDLPIIYNIAWYEQKAVIVLLALLALGVKNIHLGPTLPAFLSPTVADYLVTTFGIAGTQTADEDLALFFD